MPIIPEPTPPEEIERKVIIEEFTGVTCVNCPQGSAEIENLLAIYGENLIAVSIHAGFFAEPDPVRNSVDFRTPSGDALISFLGEPQGYPSAVIDRKFHNGNTSLQESQGTWAGIIDQELKRASSLSLLMDVDYDVESRRLELDVSGIYTDDIDRALQISVLLTENDVVEPQFTPEGWVSDYKHKHVLRAYLTGATGDRLAESAETGDDFSNSYSYTIPAEFDRDKMEVIAMVHLSGGDKDILQVESVKLTD